MSNPNLLTVTTMLLNGVQTITLQNGVPTTITLENGVTTTTMWTPSTTPVQVNLSRQTSTQQSSIQTPTQQSSIQTPTQQSSIQTPTQQSSIQTPIQQSSIQTPTQQSTISSSTVVGRPANGEESGASSSTPSSTTSAVHATTGAHKKGLSPGGKAGVAIGVIVIFVLCALLGLFLYRRRRRHRNVHNSDAADGAPSQGQVAWHEQPKDDESMLRLYREVDGRLTDHVLNFYVASDGEAYGNEISELSEDVHRDFETRVSKLEQLLPRQDSRMFVLRAIIAYRVVKAASEEAEAQKTASPTLDPGAYDSNSRGDMILRLAQVAHDETKAFAIPSSNSEARLHSMEAAVRTAVEFAFTMAKQPTRFEFAWAFRTGFLSKVVFDPQTMEDVYQAPREGKSAPTKVRATVFPGLRKWQKEEEEYLLAKTQVLLY